MMSDPHEETAVPSLADAPVTATMSAWMMVEASGEVCLFGYATSHPSTGGLSWVLSTRVVEFAPTMDKARTASNRIYALGRHVTVRELDEEGRVALRLLLSDGADGDPGRDDDVAFVTARKMARHLGVNAPPRHDPIAVERFIEAHHDAYLALLAGRRGN
jgi:hypothetical protein